MVGGNGDYLRGGIDSCGSSLCHQGGKSGITMGDGVEQIVFRFSTV